MENNLIKSLNQKDENGKTFGEAMEDAVNEFMKGNIEPRDPYYEPKWCDELADKALREMNEEKDKYLLKP